MGLNSSLTLSDAHQDLRVRSAAPSSVWPERTARFRNLVCFAVQGFLSGRQKAALCRHPGSASRRLPWGPDSREEPTGPFADWSAECSQTMQISVQDTGPLRLLSGMFPDPPILGCPGSVKSSSRCKGDLAGLRQGSGKSWFPAPGPFERVGPALRAASQLDTSEQLWAVPEPVSQHLPCIEPGSAKKE